MDTLFFIIILIMSVVIHELCHGFMADFLGDRTARYAGRLTLNPLKHLDPFGSIILPGMLYLGSLVTGHSFIFGWAKPVPYNPHNLKNEKWGGIAVASAGILANLSIACIFGILIHLAPSLGFPVYDPVNIDAFYKITIEIVLINISLALFNLVPIPPLDGSKILYPLLPGFLRPVTLLIEQYSLIALLVFVIFFSNYLYPVLSILFHGITGLYI
ncbi:site-2 protease family protein [Candidatus Nomurabacteria bacterium]|nr:site-2 protease family protein [Candidatus Nomurabacteria bacterium]